MKKTLPLLITLLILSINIHESNAQELIHSWVQMAGDNSLAMATDMTIDGQNNNCVIGNFQDTAYFGDIQLISSGDFDIFLAKYDQLGRILWAKKIGGKTWERAYSVVTDSKNNIYVAGTYMGTCMFDQKQLTASAYSENFIAKFSGEGSSIWVNSIRANTNGEKLILKIDKEDHLYYAGSFYKSMHLGNFALHSNGGADVFLSELDSLGNFIRATSLGGQGNEILQDLTIDPSKTVFLTGHFTGELDFGGYNLQSIGNEDVFISKIENFKPVWTKQAGGYYTDFANQIATFNNQVIISGSFTGEAAFGNTKLVSEGVFDAFVCAYDWDGNTIWAQKFGGKANDYVNSMLVNPDGSLYLTGSYQGKIETKKYKIESNQNSKDIYLAKFDNNGNFQWSGSFGGSNQDFAVRLGKDKDNYLYQIGSFNQNIKIGKEKAATTGRENNFFINKFYDCDLSPKVDLGKNCTLCQGAKLTAKGDFTDYLWNTGARSSSIIIEQSGTYSLIATDKYGCHSSDTTEIEMLDAPKVDLGPDIVAGTNDKILLGISEEYSAYLWYDGSTGKTLSLGPVKQDKVEKVSLTVTNEYACKATDSISITRKLNQNETKDDLNGMAYKVYPNPTSGKFYIMPAKQSQARTIQVYDMRGNLVKNINEIISFPVEIDLSGLGAGSYLLKINEDKMAREFKVVVQY